jgi:hypothetical protein
MGTDIEMNRHKTMVPQIHQTQRLVGFFFAGAGSMMGSVMLWGRTTEEIERENGGVRKGNVAEKGSFGVWR